MNIHQTAIVSKKAVIGKNVTIEQFVTIYDNVIIGDNCIIGAYSELGLSNSFSESLNLIIGSGAHIRSHSIFYEGSRFGDNLITGHRVTIREKTIAGKNFQVGTLSDIQGNCEIGDFVRTHSNVHIGQHSIIGNFVWIFPYVVLTNDPHPPSNVIKGVKVNDFAVIATMSVILPGSEISEGCLIGAHSSLSGKTTKDTIYVGNPAKEIGPTSRIKLKDGSKNPAYPWRKHFTKGYPEEIVKQWVKDV